MTRTLAIYAASVVVAGFVAAVVPSQARAGDTMTCASSDESSAFHTRDLQSRLMVAALSCNQLTAYNTFMEHFQPTLAAAGRRITSYYQRTGGGEAALNRHLTEMANAAGLSRAEAPEQFCADTWAMFLLLEDEPAGLPSMVAKHVLPGISAPSLCGGAPAPSLQDSDEPALSEPADLPPGALPVLKAAAK